MKHENTKRSYLRCIIFLVATPFWIFSFLGCKGKTVSEVDFVKSLPPSKTQGPEEVKTHGINPLGWSYSGGDGPSSWGDLRADYELCSKGNEQSPVNLVFQDPNGKKSFSLGYQKGKASLSDSGYSLRVEFTPQSQMSFDGQEYILEKAEIRSPSEHTLSTKTLPLEIQMYHRTSNGLRRGIVSLMVVEGKASPAFEPLLRLLGGVNGQTPTSSVDFDPSVLIPPKKTFYQYRGSLTHPPCHEGIEWFVFNTPIQMSSEQIKAIKDFYSGNSRPAQSLNGRKVINY